MSTLQGKVLVAQGGGPTAVINQSVVGVVLESRKFPQVTHVYGALHGVRGIMDEEFLDLTEATTHNLEAVACTPSSGLLSTRHKPDKADCRAIFEVCRKYGIHYFFYVGGNDSAETCHIVNQEANHAQYDLRVIHVPKTIDNDLVLTDHCPGFGSAARYVAQAFAGVNLDNRALPGVYIGVVMGRNAGFLTASSVLAKKYPDDGPHLVYVPERPLVRAKFLEDVEAVNKKYGRCVVAVSEGVPDENGKEIAKLIAESKKNQAQETDAFGHIQLSGTGALGDLLSQWVKAGTGIKRVRADTLGYPQRSFVGCVSRVDQFEAREVGEKAAQYAIWHNRDGSVVLRRIGDYAIEYDLVPLEHVAAKVRKMPDEFINSEGNGITEAFVKYCRPLAGEMPAIERIAAPKVRKIQA
ncbi:MAG: 6-phosphofructokinase [Candidatus Hydrogenedentes bacterium]|nr:6-phosphofructokinase [Candidatus Hydrogenedentota bacterium]